MRRARFAITLTTQESLFALPEARAGRHCSQCYKVHHKLGRLNHPSWEGRIRGVNTVAKRVVSNSAKGLMLQILELGYVAVLPSCQKLRIVKDGAYMRL